MNKFSLLNKLIVQEGKNEEMVDILLEAAESMKDLAECEIYLVNIRILKISLFRKKYLMVIQNIIVELI